MNEKIDELNKIESELEDAIHNLNSFKKDELLSFKAKWLSKDGLIKLILKNIKDIDPELKAEYSSKCNLLRNKAEEALNKAEESLKNTDIQNRLKKEFFDMTLPSKTPGLGKMNPLSIAEVTISKILKQCGFKVVSGPLIESELYCFDSLNIKKDHPARDLQDTFFCELPSIENKLQYQSFAGKESQYVLRTHTTSIQARYIEKSAEKKEFPLKIVTYGSAFRNEAEDATHTSNFHQFELVWIEKGITLSNLMGLISFIIKELFGKRQKIRFVPKFYPYTEPSIGVQIEDTKFDGNYELGSGWITIAGAGMIHQNVFKAFNLQDEGLTGVAFGIGTSRIASSMINSTDIRDLYGNDLRRQ